LFRERLQAMGLADAAERAQRFLQKLRKNSDAA